MSETSHLEKVTELVQNHAAGAELSREHGREITYTLPLTAVDKFVGKLECIIVTCYSCFPLNIFTVYDF